MSPGKNRRAVPAEPDINVVSCLLSLNSFSGCVGSPDRLLPAALKRGKLSSKSGKVMHRAQSQFQSYTSFGFSFEEGDRRTDLRVRSEDQRLQTGDWKLEIGLFRAPTILYAVVVFRQKQIPETPEERWFAGSGKKKRPGKVPAVRLMTSRKAKT
jgi:hypothetical protein